MRAKVFSLMNLPRFLGIPRICNEYNFQKIADFSIFFHFCLHFCEFSRKRRIIHFLSLISNSVPEVKGTSGISLPPPYMCAAKFMSRVLARKTIIDNVINFVATN